MSTDSAIRVRGLGKKYRLGGPQERYGTLRDSLRKLASLRALSRIGRRPERPTFWALKDVSFDIARGEAVAIIGRNGAGKSTLLKVLSRITEPTEGEADIYGRVGSLLEVGTGFHPELSGRENIYLNGAILGMRRGDIVRKFDEIVAFAEVEAFVDTPVKHYSSGMYTRLAFAVAAHLEPEILVVDEVLAVGDAEFQKKCLGKMGQVAREGRTVLFVSHNMSAVQSLCSRAVLLQKGRVVRTGPVVSIIPEYLAQAAAGFEYVGDGVDRPIGLRRATLEVADEPGREELIVTAWLHSDRATSLAIDVRLTDPLGVPIAYGSLGGFAPSRMVAVEPGVTRVTLRHDIRLLATGSYQMSIDVTKPNVDYYHRAESCLSFECNTPAAELGATRLSQGWGKGSWELPTEALDVTPLGPQEAAALAAGAPDR